MLEPLDWISTQKQKMIDRLVAWATINSGSDNLPGLKLMLKTLESSFSSLEGSMERVTLPGRSVVSPSGELISSPHGQALRITKRPEAPFRILLGGHMDTVYSPSHPFQTVSFPEKEIMRGPGVADMKGGLLIMLTALQALEMHPAAENIGWEILINPDEEIGSIGSELLFREAAKRCHLGLIFEPSFADGAIVSSRKGSTNFTVIARGKAAHAGRDFAKGRNAILALADYITKACKLNDLERGISINPGCISGGGPVNIVPDLAICRLNARAIHPTDFEMVRKKLEALAINHKEDGLELSFHLENARGPKLFDEKCKGLFEMIDACAKEEGYTLSLRPSGGVCDGNLLAEEGLPVIDTLGAIGGEIHTANEYIMIDSLVQRSRLAALFLIKLAVRTN
jgi:glutamate carboxypeptidase